MSCRPFLCAIATFKDLSPEQRLRWADEVRTTVEDLAQDNPKFVEPGSLKRRLPDTSDITSTKRAKPVYKSIDSCDKIKYVDCDTDEMTTSEDLFSDSDDYGDLDSKVAFPSQNIDPNIHLVNSPPDGSCLFHSILIA